MKQLVPAAEELSPTLVAFGKLAPEAKGFFEGLIPVINRAPTGFPALRKLFRDDFPPLLRALDPFIRNLNPLLTGLNLYKHEVTAFFANIAAATNAHSSSKKSTRTENIPHYLRAIGPLNPETVATYSQPPDHQPQQRLQPAEVGEGLAAACPASAPASARPGPACALDPDHAGIRRLPGTRVAAREGEGPLTEEEILEEAEDLFERIKQFAFGGADNTANVPAPRLQAAVPDQVDLRQRRSHALPAHLRTDGQVTRAD